METTGNGSNYLKRAAVADLFEVHPTTVDRWARQGRFGDAAWKTPGGQWRYLEGPVRAMVPLGAPPPVTGG